ncbi:MAG: DUF1801 domain-containing protein [Pseudomonadota bacterium]
MASSDLFSELKSLIFEAAEQSPRIGDLEESLKWGEPSFTPKKKNVGSSVRLAQRDGAVAMMFICTTKLVDRFQEIYPDDFNYEGGRALVFNAGEAVPKEQLKHCIAMALTNKLKN